MFYSQSLPEYVVLNRFSYKGKGRPKKTDYCTFMELIRLTNIEMQKAVGISPYMLGKHTIKILPKDIKGKHKLNIDLRKVKGSTRIERD